MQTLCRIAFVVLCSCLPATVLADGLIYQLPPDGTWARFQADVTGERPDGTVETMTGTFTLSSVGVAEVDGEACRWIEIRRDLKRNDQSVTALHKLLIPEKHLGKGQDPLPHVHKAWFSPSQTLNGTAQEIPGLKGTDRQQLNMLHPYLYGPIKNSKPLSPLEVESKLGKLNCEGVTAQENTEPGTNVTLDSTYLLRLHRSAPFGVVTYESTSKLQLNNKDQGAMKLKLKLMDFGKGAKSKLPDSK